jgi:hypothetical protein
VVLAHTGFSSYTYLGQLKITINICNNFNMLSALKKTQVFNIHIYFCYGRAFVRLVNFTGGLLSAQSFSWEGFCPPCYFHGRAFVRPVIFTGGLLSALSFFDRRAFVRFPKKCPPFLANLEVQTSPRNF